MFSPMLITYLQQLLNHEGRGFGIQENEPDEVVKRLLEEVKGLLEICQRINDCMSRYVWMEELLFQS